MTAVYIGDPLNPPILDLSWEPSVVQIPIGVGIPGSPGADGAPGEPGPPGADGAPGAGFNFTDAWDVATAYQPMDVVTSEGSTFVATEDNQGIEPGHGTPIEVAGCNSQIGSEGTIVGEQSLWKFQVGLDLTDELMVYALRVRTSAGYAVAPGTAVGLASDFDSTPTIPWLGKNLDGVPDDQQWHTLILDAPVSLDVDTTYTLVDLAGTLSLDGENLLTGVMTSVSSTVFYGANFATSGDFSLRPQFGLMAYSADSPWETMAARGEPGQNGTNGTDGTDGAPGPPGADGDKGDPGPGLPAGGTAGQLPVKASSTDYDVEWEDAPDLTGFVPRTGSPADVNSVGLKILANTGQVSNLLETYDDSGTLRGFLGPTGSFGGSTMALTAKTASSVPMVIQGFLAQSTDLERWRSSTAATLARIAKDGRAEFPNVREVFVSVKDPTYAADSTGVTSASTAINNAILFVAAAGGGTVYLPAGIYLLSAAISLRSNVCLIGAGRGFTTIKAGTGVATAVLVGTSGNAVSNVTFSGFTIDGDYSNSALTLPGIQITNGTGCRFIDLGILNTAREGIKLNTHSSARVEGCLITGTGADGTSTGHAVSLVTCVRARVTFNEITGGKGMGVSLSTASTDCLIEGNYISTAASTTGLECIGIAATNDRCIVEGNHCINSQDNGISMSSNDSTVSHNIINGALNNGISVGASRCTVECNVIKNAGQDGTAVAAGISLPGSATPQFNTIIGNTIYDDQVTKTMDYGIRETTGADWNLLVGNIARDADVTTTGIVLVGADSVNSSNIPFSGGGSTPARATATATTSSLAPLATDGTTTITLSKGYVLYSIMTSRKARVELYGTAAALTADSARPVGTAPAIGTNLVLDFVTAAAATVYPLSPRVVGSNDETVPSTTISMAVTNEDSTTGTIVVTLVWLKVE